MLGAGPLVEAFELFVSFAMTVLCCIGLRRACVRESEFYSDDERLASLHLRFQKSLLRPGA